MKTAVIAGATGLVGTELLHQILSDSGYNRVVTLARRDIEVSHPKLEKIVGDLKQPEKLLTGVRPDDVFCCLGTTMASAGSKEKFYEVDFEIPLALAHATLALGASQYLLVSALGANPGSRVYYNRVKGEIEQAVQRVGFRTVHVFRPSLLLGERKEKRAGEDAAKVIYKLFGFLVPRKYKGIQASAVARAMLVAAGQQQTGTLIHESAEMQRFS